MESVTNKANANHGHVVPCLGTWAWARCSMVPQLVRRLALVARLLALSGLALTVGVGTVIAAELPSFEIVARDGRLFPERLEVPAGVKLKLTLRNEGKTPVEFENLELRIERVVPPDAAASVTVQALRPGRYAVIDDFHADTGKMLLIAK